MLEISWNEVRDRAIRFARSWEDATSEIRDKQTFWNEFFDCFGVPRRSVAVFEHALEGLSGRYQFLDLFWRGVLLVEHKSAGASFDKAGSQAFRYLEELANTGRHDEIPRYLILCDFQRFALYDLEPEPQLQLPLFDGDRAVRVVEFPLRELHRHVREFAFVKGERAVRLDPEDPANLKATQLLANLHDELEATGYVGHPLERYLVRLLFCLFAEDTGIFEPGSFTALIERTREDGASLGQLLSQLWDVLNTDERQRQRTLDEELAAFQFVNGGLFAEPLPVCSFNSGLRAALIECAHFHWAKISPAVFGSLFQGVMDDRERRQIGAHYTSERDILKLLRALFLDDLRARVDAALEDRSSRRIERLTSIQTEIRRLRLFDPACGCGNFLILAYRELRRLERDILVAIHGNVGGETQRHLNIRELAQVDVDQFFGIEIGEWPVRIAEVGLWLTDHQCNQELAEALGQRFVRLPLQAAPTLVVGNSLRLDWTSILPPSDSVIVLGNPPFVGKKEQAAEQKADMNLVWGDTSGVGILDYVTCWYRKAAEYMQGARIRCAFVSTSSILQGEQVGVFWNEVFRAFRLTIHFAHRAFAWTSEARGRAHVHVVIVGFGNFTLPTYRLFDYPDAQGEPVLSVVSRINAYLVEAPDVVLTKRSAPIGPAPLVGYGSFALDDGNYTLSDEDRRAILAESPGAAQFIRPFIGGNELIHGVPRWCLWLVDASPRVLRGLSAVMRRVEAVQTWRASRDRQTTLDLARTPTVFAEIRQPTANYVAFPTASSERRTYIPIAYLTPDIIASNQVYVIAEASLFHFGVLTSAMHMAWVRVACGRLESRFRYSASIVYNNFPWPSAVETRDRRAVEVAAQQVLDVRSAHAQSTLADLYDPLAMPAPLADAHWRLDRAVDRCYRREPFPTDRARVEHLFALYERTTEPLLPVQAPPSRRRRPRR